MPTIPNMSLPSFSIDADEIYNNGLYSPANPPQSVEVLNGGLEQANYDGGNGSIKPYMMDLGTFARGYSINFSRREFMYARQLDENINDHVLISSSIATQVFIPFEARVIHYGFQCWFNHDASKYIQTEPPATKREFWSYRLRVFPSSIPNAAYDQSTNSTIGRLPFGRQFTGAIPGENDGVHEEARWYYVHKASMLSGPFLPGYKDLRLEISASIQKPYGSPTQIDEYIAKCKLMSGTIWVLALR